MKAYLEFNLPEDENLFEYANKSADMMNLLRDYDNYLRNNLKHNTMHEVAYAAHEDCRNTMIELLKEYDINIWS